MNNRFLFNYYYALAISRVKRDMPTILVDN
jgi:hypothetical protein